MIGLLVQHVDLREDSSWSVITGETGLAHTGTIVDNEGSDFVLPICQMKAHSRVLDALTF